MVDNVIQPTRNQRKRRSVSLRLAAKLEVGGALAGDPCRGSGGGFSGIASEGFTQNERKFKPWAKISNFRRNIHSRGIPMASIKPMM